VAWLYVGDYEGCISEVLQCNPELSEVLLANTSNVYCPNNWEHYTTHKDLRIGHLAGITMRCRNEHIIPCFTLLLTLEAKYKGINQHMWDMLSMVRVLASRTWVRATLLPLARMRYPGPRYEVLDCVTAAAYDNFTIQVNYQAMQTEGDDGWRMDMTNWMTIHLPNNTMPAGMSLQNLILGDNGIFKPGFDKFSIIDMFDPDNPEIGAERVSRFTESMAQIADGTFFHRPTGAQGHQPAHATSHQNHKPIFDRCALQPRLGHCMHIWG